LLCDITQRFRQAECRTELAQGYAKARKPA
jgi:hypothetical protein